jgi:hypothetical protein
VNWDLNFSCCPQNYSAGRKKNQKTKKAKKMSQNYKARTAAIGDKRNRETK